jgi:hypothetical protein
MKTVRRVILYVALCLAAPLATSAELLTNGNFEAGFGNFTGWTQGANSGLQTIAADFTATPLNHSGLVFADGASLDQSGGGAIGYLSQDVLTALGTSYTLQFDVQRWASGTEPADNFVEVAFNGVVLFSENDTASDWKHYSFTVAGTGASGTLRIGNLNLLDYNQWDNFSLTYDDVVPPPPGGDVPEPASMAMTLLGLGLLGWARRKKI